MTQNELVEFREKLKTMTKAEKKALLKKYQNFVNVLSSGNLNYELHISRE